MQLPVMLMHLWEGMVWFKLNNVVIKVIGEDDFGLVGMVEQIHMVDSD